MCTLTIAWRVLDDPVVVAANRDEALDRPSDPPSRIESDPEIVAPRDREAGGTWTGYNEFGVFVGVTNRWVAPPEASLRSRGQLVLDCLRLQSAEDAARHVERAVERDAYAGFNLVVADASAAFLLEWTPAKGGDVGEGLFTVTPLEPGVHVVVNVGAALGGGGRVTDHFFVSERRPDVGQRQADNARRVRAELTPDAGETATAWLNRAARVLGDHEYGVCVHGGVSERTADETVEETVDKPVDKTVDETEDETLADETVDDRRSETGGYGTRSSSLVRLGEDAEYRFADGPPCVTAFETVRT